jgi:phage terminase large subunit
MVELGVRKNYDQIWADGARPEAIEEIRQYGFNIQAAEKGPGSLEDGIDTVNKYRQHWAPRSINSIKEQRNYRFITDANGKPTKKPMDSFNHSMDGRRYSVVMMGKDCMPGIGTV